jgi:hypothetical protein
MSSSFEESITSRINPTAIETSELINAEIVNTIVGKETASALRREAQKATGTQPNTETEWSRMYNYQFKKKDPFIGSIIEGFKEGYNNENPFMQNAIETRSNDLLTTQANINECDLNANNIIDNFTNQEKSTFNLLKNTTETLLTSLENLDTFLYSYSTIANEKTKFLNKITNKIETYNQNMFMDDRKSKYTIKNYEFYKSIHFFILLAYYFLFILFLIFSDFIKEEKYKNKFAIALTLIYLLIPFILKYILVYIYNTYIYILEYNNLKEQVISYPHIINS